MTNTQIMSTFFKWRYTTVLSIIFFITIFFLFRTTDVFAQSFSSGTAVVLPISEQGVVNGDIIVTNGKGYQRSSIPYDSGLCGVVTLQPAASFGSIETSGA